MIMTQVASRSRMLALAGFLATLLPGVGAAGILDGGSQKTQAAPPHFEDLPAPDRFDGKPAPVKILTKQARTYRTMLRDGAKEGPNFAGHYTIAQWGCGGGCVQFAIIDARTGDVFFPQFSVSVVADGDVKMDQIPEPLQFKQDSKLLIVTGARNEKGGGRYYYKWDNNRLALITSTPLAKP